MANNSYSRINREAQGTMSDAQKNRQVKQHKTEHHEERVVSKQSRSAEHEQSDYPIRIHDPDIESVVGLGYD
ncbi:MAG: hypothetical protein R3F02_05025 [Thiolinea sp.]